MNPWGWSAMFAGLIVIAAMIVAINVREVRHRARELEVELRRLHGAAAPLQRAVARLERATDEQQARRLALEASLTEDEIIVAQRRRIAAARLARMRYRLSGRVSRHISRPIGQTGEADPYTEAVHQLGSVNE